MPDALWQIVHRLHDLVVVDHLGGTLQKAAVQVEYVTGISLAAWWTAEEQRYLTIRYSLLRQIIIYHKGRTTGVAEELTDGGASEWREELKWCRIGCRGSY